MTLSEADLAARIETYCHRTGESTSAFGRRVAGDGNLFRDLTQGRSPRLRLVREILAATESSGKSDSSASDVSVIGTETAA